jgi:cysteinyl-tRNA synthetase
MAIQLYDSLERRLKPITPSQPDGVIRFYNCGPTVYAPAHIGNFRTFVVNDVIRRLLELEFGPDKVKHVRNLTDVDDKTIRRAREEGRPLAAVTQQWTDKFHADCAALNCLPPHVEPTATGYIREQVDMIDVLMRKGNAYRAADGSVYFKVSSFEDYGRLSRVKERELQVGSALAGKVTAADADEKEDVSDFALWKAHKPDDGANAWDSPWGRGRPGWHIECSAMSKALLGETIDLHTGGVDLLFPHHENEIAQSQCCNGTTFARHWYHSEHLLVDGKKMSKSLGNLYTLDDLVAKGFSPMALRYALLMGHPRKQLNFSIESLQSAEKAMIGIRDRIQQYGANGNALFFRSELEKNLPKDDAVNWGSFAGAWDLLREDLNVPAALGAAFSAFITITDLHLKGGMTTERWLVEFLAAKRFFERALGVDLQLKTVEERNLKDEAQASAIPTAITALAEKRWAAKQAKDFAAADALRQELAAAGWSMLDSKTDYKLEPLKK